jgi:uncharacterized protein
MQELVHAPLIELVRRRFVLDDDSIHGICHWGRVLENGVRLAEMNGADVEVVALFALFHDSCRENDKTDPMHGPRAAKWIREIASTLPLSDIQVDLLVAAVAGHTNKLHHKDVTVATCWDADRLDIGRTGCIVNPVFLNTKAACLPETLAWAQQRGMEGHVPDFINQYL